MTEEDKVRANLQKTCRYIETELLPGNHWGFILMVFPYGTGTELLYVAKCQRDDALQVMREFIAKNTNNPETFTEQGQTDADRIFDAWWHKELKRIDSTKLHDQGVARQLAFDAFMAGMVWSVT